MTGWEKAAEAIEWLAAAAVVTPIWIAITYIAIEFADWVVVA